MTDMSQVIIPKSDQLNSDSLVSGPITITITDVKIRPGTEQPVDIHYANENGAPWRPCKSMSRILVSAWGPDAKQYVGRSVTLYRDPTVKWGGMEVGGIRISHMSHIDGKMVMALTATKGSRKPFTVMPLATGPAPEGLTLDQARTDIESAADLDELKTVWTRKSMQPHRESLQNDLDARKAALAAEGPTDDQRGDQHDDDTVKSKIQITANDIIARAKNATTTGAIDNLAGVLEQHRAAMTEDMVLDCEVAISDARGRV